MMQYLRLLILLVLVVGLGSFIWFYERHLPTTEEAARQASRVLGALQREEIQALEITNAHGTFRIERRGDDWQVVSPVDYPAQSGAVESLLSALLGLEIQRTLDPKEVQPEAYQLDHPPFTVVLTTKDGQQHTLRVGTATPLGDHRVVTLDQGDRLLVVPGWFTSRLDRDLDGWRSDRVMQVFLNDVASVAWKQQGQEIRVVRKGPLWYLEAPHPDLADRDRIRGLLADLNALRVRHFEDAQDPQKRLREMGLDPPRIRIEITPKKGDPIVLELGRTRTREETTEVAARRDEKYLYWVDDRVLSRFEGGWEQWRASEVYPVDPWKVQRLHLQSGEQTITVSKVEGTWKAGTQTADEKTVEGLIDRLSRLKVQSYGPLPQGARKVATLDLHFKDTAVDPPQEWDAHLTFYGPVQKEGPAWVVVEGRPDALAVDASEAEAIVLNPDRLLKEVTSQKAAQEARKAE